MKKALEKKSVIPSPAGGASYSVVARIKRNITALAVVPLVLASVALTLFAYTAAKNSLSERVVAQLTTVRTSQASAIERYFENLGGTLQVTASTPSVIEAVKSMSTAFPQLKTRAGADIANQRAEVAKYYNEQFAAMYAKRAGKPPGQLRELLASLSDETIAAQYLYIASNNFALGKKNDLVAAIDGSDYSKAHATIQEFFGTLQAKFGFYDFFLVDPVSGSVLYTYFKEIDFGTSLLGGPYSKSALARAFEASTKTAKRSEVWMSDYEPYYPSFESQSAFMSVPVMDGERMVGVLIAQVPVDRVNREMTFGGKWQDVGLGNSGETYLVDGWWSIETCIWSN
jgi:methyl-accepting chemotaxis protein